MVVKYDYNTPNSLEIFEKKEAPNPDSTLNIEDFSYFGKNYTDNVVII